MGLEEQFVEGPFFSWYDADTTDEQISEMLRGVLKFVQHNRIDAVFGFSQGAAVISACMLPEIQLLLSFDESAPSTENSRVSRRGSVGRVPFRKGSITLRKGSIVNSFLAGLQPRSLKFVICAHAIPINGICERFNISPNSRVATSSVQRSVHIIGTSDPFKAQSEDAALLFQGGITRMVLYHSAAHELPRHLQANEVFHQRLMGHIMVSPQTQGATIPVTLTEGEEVHLSQLLIAPRSEVCRLRLDQQYSDLIFEQLWGPRTTP
jgi:hypothetical protein